MCVCEREREREGRHLKYALSLTYSLHLQVLPPEFGTLTSLVTLELEGNAFVRPPPIVIDQGCEVYSLNPIY